MQNGLEKQEKIFFHFMLFHMRYKDEFKVSFLSEITAKTQKYIGFSTVSFQTRSKSSSLL